LLLTITTLNRLLVTALEHCITTRGEAHRNEYCIHETSKLQRKEGKEVAKRVAYSKICGHVEYKPAHLTAITV
jgi:hypothetical protein